MTLNNNTASFAFDEDLADRLEFEADTISGADTVFVLEVMVTSGTLEGVDGTGVVITGSNSTTVRLQGTGAALNTYLSSEPGLTYKPAQDENGTFSLSLKLFNDPVTDPAISEVSRSIVIAAVNDAPTFTGLEATVTYQENTVNTAGELLDGAVSIGDVEGNFDGGKVTVSGLLAEDVIAVRNQGTGEGQIGFDGSTVTYAGIAIGTLVRDTATGVTTITLNGAATSAKVEALVENLTYQTTSDTPTATRDLVVTVSDSDAATASGTITVAVTAENDAPTFTGLEASVTYLENTVNTAGELLDGAVSIGDVEGNFDGGKVTVSGLLAEDVIAVRNQGAAAGQIGFDGSTVTYAGIAIGTLARDPGVTTITLNGAATSAAVEALVENLTYQTTSDTPTATRDLVVTVSDSDAATASGTITVAVTAENDPPALTNLADPIVLAENTVNAGPVPLIANAGGTLPFGFADPEGNVGGGSLTISGFLHEDLVALPHQGSAAGQIGVVNGTVSFGGTDFAVMSGGAPAAEGLRTPLVFGFNAAASNAAIEALLETLTYANQSDVPTVTRTITLDLVDGAGADRAYTTVLQVNRENDALTAGSLPATLTILEDINGRLDLSGLAITDRDVTDTIDLVLTLTAGRLAAEPSSAVTVQSTDDGRQLTLSGRAADLRAYLADPNVVRLTGPADLTGPAAVTLTASATDAGPVTISLGSSKITLVAQPDAPVLTGLRASVSFTETEVNSNTPHPLGLAVTITDPEADFAGGRLTVSGLVPADRVGIANADGIVVVGTETLTVRFNDTVIGTAQGGAGADLVVTFNAAATLEGITAVVDALTYQQITEAPVASHALYIALTDAAGNGLGETSGIAFSFSQTAQADSPFAGIDFGVNTDPAFADLDGDGDLDLVVGLVGGTLTAYENTGSGFAVMATNPFAGIDVGARSSPVFADVTGDGRADLVVGDNLGGFKVFKATDGGFVALTGAANPLDGLDVGSNAKPAFVDLDRDGDLDLVAGGADGQLHAFENAGGTFVVPLSWRDPFVQLALTGSGVMQFTTVDLTDLASSVASLTQTGSLHTTLSSATLAGQLRLVPQNATTANWSLSLNGDSFAYLAAGQSVTLTYVATLTDRAGISEARQFVVTVTGTATDPLISLNSLGANVTGSVAQGLVPITVSNGAHPAFADLDGDGDDDLVIGDGNGGLRSFTNTGTGTGWQERVGSDNPFAGLSVGTMAAPALVDLDQDGRPDAIIGNRDGALALWRNTTPEGLALQVLVTGENDAPSGSGLPSDLVVRGTVQSALDLRTLKLVDPDETDLLDLVLVATTGRLTATAAPDVTVTGAGTATLALRGTAAALNGYLADPARVSFLNSDARASGDNAARVDVTIDDSTGVVALGAINLDIAPGNGTSHLSNLGPLVAFTETQVNGGPQIIDSDVYFVSLSESFAGGQLTITGLLPEDLLGVRDGGAGANQIGVVVNAVTAQQEVTYGGQTIGTLTGGAGTALSVTFNSHTSAGAIDRLLESLTYANNSDTPTASRSLTLQITDADGVGLTAAGPAATTFALVSGAASPLTGKDVGSYAAPALGDVTGDGRIDLVVGNSFGLLTVYAGSQTGFTLMEAASAPFAGIDVGSYAAPVLTDLDGDGRADVVVGTSTGQLVVLRASETGFTQLIGTANPFAGIDVGSHAAPAFADIDGDGDLDIVVGNSGGRLIAYAHTGVVSAVTGLPVYSLLAGAQDPFVGIDVGSRSRPDFFDVDQDGDMDLFIANSAGAVSGFLNTGTGFVAMSAQTNPFTGLTAGRYGSLSFGDVDGDGDADAVLGDSLGQMVLIANTTEAEQPVTLVVTVEPQNDAPSGVGLPTSFAAAAQTATVLDLSGLVLADPDSPSLALVLTVTHGTLAAEDMAGIGITGSGTASLRLLGSVEALNSYLQEDHLLRYTGAAAVTGTGADTLVVTVDDGIGPVSLGAAAINISPFVLNSPPSGSVAIIGTPAQDQTLTADTSTLSDADGLGPLSYTWKANGVIIPRGDNVSSLTLTEAETGKVITLQVSYVDGAGTTETLASAATAAVAANPDSTPPFRIELASQAGGVAQFAIYANASADADGDGIGAFEFTLSHDPADLLINVNSFAVAPGVAGLPNYNAATGVLSVAGAVVPNLTDLQTPLASFSATVLGGDKSVQLNLTETQVDAVPLETVTAEFALTGASGGDPMTEVTTTIVDRFGDPLLAVAASATATVNGEQIQIREIGTSAVGTIFEIVVTPATALVAIDFVLTDFTTLGDLALAPALADWVVLTYRGTPNTVSFSGFGDISGDNAIPVGGETVLATFTTAAEPELLIANIALNGIAQPAIGVADIAASGRSGHVVTFEVQPGADLRIMADLPIDTAAKAAISSFDALQALRLAVGLPKSDGTAEWHDYIAADFNRDGRVGADDALNILKYAVDLAGGPEAEWIFVDAAADWTGIDRNNVTYAEGLRREDLLVDTGVGMIGILVGDVDGSYVV